MDGRVGGLTFASLYPMSIVLSVHNHNHSAPLAAAAKEDLADQRECAICFEEFRKGQKMARLNCLCTYHQHCIDDWFSRGNHCPVHYR